MKSLICQHDLPYLCWPWPPAEAMFVRVPCWKATLFPFFCTVLSGRKSCGQLTPKEQRAMPLVVGTENLHRGFVPPPLFIYSFIYLIISFYQYGPMGIYFMSCVIIQHALMRFVAHIILTLAIGSFSVGSVLFNLTHQGILGLCVSLSSSFLSGTPRCSRHIPRISHFRKESSSGNKDLDMRLGHFYYGALPPGLLIWQTKKNLDVCMLRGVCAHICKHF